MARDAYCLGCATMADTGTNTKPRDFKPMRPGGDAGDGHRIEEGRAHRAAIGARLGFKVRQPAVDFQRRLDRVQRRPALRRGNADLRPPRSGTTDWLAAPLSKNIKPAAIEIGQDRRQRLAVGEKALAQKIGHPGIAGEARQRPGQALGVGSPPPGRRARCAGPDRCRGNRSGSMGISSSTSWPRCARLRPPIGRHRRHKAQSPGSRRRAARPAPPWWRSPTGPGRSPRWRS